jgi:hypothetical protein
MKTKEHLTQCPEKSRTFLSKFRTFTANRHEFHRKMRSCGDNLPAQFGKSKEIAERSNKNDTPQAGVFERSAAILAAQCRRVAGAKSGTMRNHTDLPKTHDPVILVVHLAHITYLAKRNGSVSLGRRMASGWWLV